MSKTGVLQSWIDCIFYCGFEFYRFLHAFTCQLVQYQSLNCEYISLADFEENDVIIMMIGCTMLHKATASAISVYVTEFWKITHMVVPETMKIFEFSMALLIAETTLKNISKLYL